MKKKFFRKCTSLLVVLLMLLSMVPTVYAAGNGIQVQLNGDNIAFDVAPRMVNGRIMVPMRAIFEKLGANVKWDEPTQTITVDKDGTTVQLKMKSQQATVTENQTEKKVQLEAAPVVDNGRTLVPVRFIAESFGYQVGWDSEANTVIIIDYKYFINELKTKAPNFYQYATTEYTRLNTGELKQAIQGSFKYIPKPGSSTYDAKKVHVQFDANLDGKINPQNGSLDIALNLSGFDELFKGSPMEGVNNISYNLLVDQKSIYVKSNLFKILEEQANIQIGDKWLKADIADLNIPDVTTYQDLLDQQNSQQAKKDFMNQITSGQQLDVNSFKEIKQVFDVFVTLIDNVHFKVTENGDMKVYKWKITKQDLVNIALSVEKSKGNLDLSVQDLAEIKEFVDKLAFDFNMEVAVKNNIVVSNNIYLNFQMETPDKEQIALVLKTNAEVLNPNNSSFVINIPDPSEVIDFKEVQPDSSPENVY